MTQTPLQSIRSNSMPVGGVTALQSVAPNATPPDIAALVNDMAPLISQFRANSYPGTNQMDTITLTSAGAEKAIDFPNVGLGTRTMRRHQATITLDNTAASAQVYNLSDFFPFNLIAKSQVAINGGATVYSASGKTGLMVSLRRRRGTLGASTGLSPALVRCTFTNCSPTATSAGSFTYSGYDSVSVPATTTGTIVVTFVTEEKLAYSHDTMLGTLPLQNNQVNCQLTTTLAGSIVGSDNRSPLYVSGGNPSTSTVSISMTTKTVYHYWNVPSNPQLYAPMVANSYQVQEEQSLTFSSTGEKALKYNMPTNQYHIALHLFAADSNYVPLAFDDITQAYVTTNAGGITVAVMEPSTYRALQLGTYGDDIFQVPGYWLWDGDATSDDIVMTDDAGWINAYTLANPQFAADIASGVSTTGNYSVTREVIVAGNVAVA